MAPVNQLSFLTLLSQDICQGYGDGRGGGKGANTKRERGTEQGVSDMQNI